MKKQIVLLSVCAVMFLSSGCIFIPTSQWTVDKWRGRIYAWIPLGTSREDLIRIMTKHGFEHSPTLGDGDESFSKDTGFNQIFVMVRMEHGKTAWPSVDVMRDGDL